MTGIIITYGLLLWAVIGSLFNPLYGFTAYACLSVLQPQAFWTWSLPSGDRLSLISGSAMALGWLLHMGGDLRLGRAWWGTVALGCFWGWAFVAGLNADFPHIAEEYLTATAKIVFPCIVGVTSIRTKRDLHLVAWTLILSQTVLAYFLNERYLTTQINTPQDGYGSMDNVIFGASLGVILALSSCYVLFSARRWVQLLAFVSVALIGHTILLTDSRGALLQITVVGMAIAYLMPKTRATLTMVSIVVVCAIAVTGPRVYERFSTVFAAEEKRDDSAKSRFVLWSNCLVLISENPVMGVGPEHFGRHAPRFGWKLGKEAHHYWLQTAAEIGIPGVLFLLFYYLAPVWSLYWRFYGSNRYRDPPDPDLEVFACMSISAIAGFIVSSQFVTVSRLETPFYAGVLALGTLKLADRPYVPPWNEQEELAEWDEFDEVADEAPAHASQAFPS